MKFKLLAAPLVLALILGVGWIAQSQPSDTMKRLPAGAWTLVARESGHALLAPKPRRNLNQKGLEEKAVTAGQALVIGPGGSTSLISTRSRGLFVGGPDSQPRVWSTQFMGRRVLFNPVGSAPGMAGMPERAGDYLFSAESTVWRMRPGAAPEKLVADSAAGFSRQDLAAGPGFEADVDLTWAAAPVASPDGRFVAYVSNREAIKTQSSGQSVWMVDYESGHEEALLDRSGESFTPLGWMREELLFTGDQGGISAVDPVSGQVHEMSAGTFLAVEPSAGVAAVLEGDEPSRRTLVITKGGTRTRVARQGRLEYAGTADFSPDGSRLAVVLSARNGSKQIQIVDVSTGESQLLPLPNLRREGLTDPPRWVDDQTLLVTTSLRRTGEERSSLLSVPASNAR
jgi:WD40-like Beta Propeller Repeat